MGLLAPSHPPFLKPMHFPIWKLAVKHMGWHFFSDVDSQNWTPSIYLSQDIWVSCGYWGGGAGLLALSHVLPLKPMCFLMWKLQVILRGWGFCGVWIARAKLHWYTFHMVYSFHGSIWHVGCIYWFCVSFGPFFPSPIHAFPNIETGRYTLWLRFL